MFAVIRVFVKATKLKWYTLSMTENTTSRYRYYDEGFDMFVVDVQTNFILQQLSLGPR